MYLKDYLRELVFPTSCAGCGETEGQRICPECLLAIPLIPAPACKGCASPTLYPVPVCNECRKRRLALDATVALAFYRDPMRSVIHRFKYRNGRRLAPLLAALLSARLEERTREAGLPEKVEGVTFVPMHPRRERERGYNQARLLAEELACCRGLDCHPLLVRNRATPAQTGLSHAQRLGNLKGCIEVREGRAVSGTYLLVDDVFTTGATLSECARALKLAGASSVIACVLARDLPLIPAAGIHRNQPAFLVNDRPYPLS